MITILLMHMQQWKPHEKRNQMINTLTIATKKLSHDQFSCLNLVVGGSQACSRDSILGYVVFKCVLTILIGHIGVIREGKLY